MVTTNQSILANKIVLYMTVHVHACVCVIGLQEPLNDVTVSVIVRA